MAGQGFLVLHKGLHMLGYPMQMHQDDGVPLLGVGLCPMRTLIIDVEQRRKPGTYEHLALLVRFLKSGDPFVFRVTADRKIFYAFPVGARNRLLGMYVQMRPEDDPLLHGLQRVMDTGGEVALLLPGTVRALDALATFPGGSIDDLPMGEMLETRVAFGLHGELSKVESHRLTPQEIGSLSPLPGLRVRAA